MKIVKFILKFLLFVLIIITLFFLYMWIDDYHSPARKQIVKNNCPEFVCDTFSVLTWNIGYAGLDSSMDFFYEGGRKMRQTESHTNNNMQKISDFVKSNDSVDFLMFQEVDRCSKRSYKIDEFAKISSEIPEYLKFFTTNYNVGFVPLPLGNPMGKVLSGLALFSKKTPCEVVHYGYPNKKKFPQKIFLYDNCFMVARMNLKSGRQLVVVNTHNSAYDDGGERLAQLEYLRKFVLNEYDLGNYVIVGGDWNQNPPDSNLQTFNSKYFTPFAIDADFMPQNWTWVFENKSTNRYLYEPYSAGKTATTLIDFFLMSPNLNCLNVKVVDLNFANSDHNPVIATFFTK